MSNFFEGLLAVLINDVLLPLSSGYWRHLSRLQWRRNIIKARQKQETKESLDHFTHQHTPHWEYIKDVVSWRMRLRLSRFRGKKRALAWRIKLIALFSGLGPQVAQWLFEEYMITAKVEDLPAPARSWVCAHCGTANADTALFCKDCGEYK